MMARPPFLWSARGLRLTLLAVLAGLLLAALGAAALAQEAPPPPPAPTKEAPAAAVEGNELFEGPSDAAPAQPGGPALDFPGEPEPAEADAGEAGAAPPAAAAPPEPPRRREPVLPQSMAEVSLVETLRAQWAEGEAEALAESARQYLERYPDGRYADEARLALADAQAAQGDDSAAAEAYAALGESGAPGPFSEYAAAAAYEAYRRQGEREAASAALERLLEQHPRGITRDRALVWKGRQLRAQGDIPQAIQVLERVEPDNLHREADQADYERELAMAYVARGRRLEAEPLLQRYLGREDEAAERAPVLMFLAQEAREQGRWATARRYYREVVEDYPHPPVLPEARYRYAELYARTELDQASEAERPEALKRAIGLFTAYLESGDETHAARALQHRARLHAEAGQPEKALADYDRMFQIDPAYRNEPAIVTARANLLRQQGRDQEADIVLQTARSNPEIESEARRGILLEEVRGHYEREDCPKVLARLQPLPVFDDPDHINRALFMRGFCYYREGQWERASVDLELLVRYPAYHDTAWEPLVESYDRSGQAGRLVRFLEEELQSGRVEPSRKTSHLLASGYEQLGQPAMVIRTYEELNARDPEGLQSPEAGARVAGGVEAPGQPHAAANHFAQALAAHPADAPADSAYRETWRRLQRLLAEQGEWQRLVAANETAARVLTAPDDARALRRAQRDAYLGWGRAELEAGEPDAAVPHVEAALERSEPTEREARLQALALLARAEAARGDYPAAVARYEAEADTTDDPEYRISLGIARSAVHERWAESLADAGEPDAAVAQYEAAMAHLPEGDWEARYRILLKLDPTYREAGAYGPLIQQLGTVERHVPDAAFRGELRRYRMSLYREWGLKALEGEEPGEAERPFAEAMGMLLSQQDWTGLAELSAARAVVLSEPEQFERQKTLLRDAATRAPTPDAAEQVRLALISTEYEWARNRERAGDVEGARTHYAQARDALQEGDWSWRREIVLSLAGLHASQGEREQQVAVLEESLPHAPDPPARAEMQRELVAAHEAWGDAEAEAGNEAAALAHYNAALDAAPAEDWRLRFRLTQAVGKVYLEQGDSRELIARYEALRDDVPEPALQKQIDRFLGQVYVQWAEYAMAAEKHEHARRRYHKALERLPHDEVDLRVSVAKALEDIYTEHYPDPAAAAAVYAELVPTLADPERRRQYTLYTGRMLWERAEDAEQAIEWLEQADAGGNDPVSLEAGFVLAEIELAQRRTDDAIRMLNDLVERGLDASHWRVPIHYQLAVVHHEGDRLTDALAHYRRVAGERDADVRERYPRTIAQAEAQVAEIENYLRLRGGEMGEGVDAPGFVPKPPTPGPKTL